MAWLAMLLMVLLSTGAGLLWWQGHRAQQALQRETVQRAEQRAQQLAAALAAQAQALLGDPDVALLQLRREWDADPAGLPTAVKRLVPALPPGAVSHITVVDAAGDSVDNSLEAAERVNVADRPHLRIHQQGGDRLHVGQAVRSRIARDTWTCIVKRPLLCNGRFAGTMSISVPMAYFAQQLQALARALPLPALPALPALPVPAVTTPAPRERSHRHTVLGVEDNPANLRLFEQIFAHRDDIGLVSAITSALGLDHRRGGPDRAGGCAAAAMTPT